jgi:NTE family protein
VTKETLSAMRASVSDHEAGRSNAPTEAIFEDNPRSNSLIFAVHMWNPIGPEPETIWDVLNRQKDIQYSSRVASHVARQRQVHKLAMSFQNS